MTRWATDSESPRRAGAGRRPAVSARSWTVEAGWAWRVRVDGTAAPGRGGRPRRRAVRSRGELR